MTTITTWLKVHIYFQAFLVDVGLLYLVWIGEPRLVDTRVVDGRTSDAWTHSHTSQAEFRSTIVERDGTCVVTGDLAEDCDASHCLPYTKGDEVLFNFLLPDLSPFLTYLST